jgi:hypothetical protein
MHAKVPEQALAVDVHFNDHQMIIDLEDGRELRVPLEWFVRLRNATSKDREAWRLVGGGIGIHWPALDEDISVPALLAPSTDVRVPAPPHTDLGDEEGLLNGDATPNVEAS